MESNLALNAVRSSNRLLILLGVICLVIVAIGAYFDEHQLISFFSGPREMATQALIGVQDADALTQIWVTVKGSDVFDTGWQEFTSTDNGPEDVTGSYAGLAVGNRYLLVKIPSDIGSTNLPKVYTGALTNIPSDLNDQVIADIRSQNPDVAARFLPVMLDTSDFTAGAHIALILIGVGTLIGLALLFVALRRTLNPYRHPIMTALARYGDSQQISESISQEMMLSPTPVAKGISLTRNWLVFSKGNFQAARLQDIAWAYQSVTRHRTYGITTRRTYEARVWDRYHKPITFSGKEQEVIAGLQAITQAAPWAIVGYSKEIDTQWRKNNAEFLAMVNARRQSNRGE